MIGNIEIVKVLHKLRTQKKKDLLLLLIVFVFLMVGVAVFFNNYNWYDTTIVRIEKVENSLSNQSKESDKKEKYYDQTLTGTIMNGDYHGQEAYLDNEYSSSGVLDDQYKPGDEVFVRTSLDDYGKITGVITGFKRDKYMALLSALFVMLIFIVIRRKGLFSVFSLAVNIAILWYALKLNYNGHNILMISNFLVLIFTFVSLFFISGLKKKTLIALLSTLLSLFFTMALFQILVLTTGGVDYTYMEYIAGQNHLSELFLAQILMGGLGAIMDVAITEASAMNELVDKNPEISWKELVISGREVGYDIMGTMINIMLFTYISGTIPLIILKMRNNIPLHSILMRQIPMELYRFIIGSIGILLTIPVSILVSILIFKKGRRFI